MTESSYRVRWGVVSHSNGHRVSRERMCIAERRYSFLGVRFWFPFQGAEWRFDEAQCLKDVTLDQELRSQLPEPRLVLLHRGDEESAP